VGIYFHGFHGSEKVREFILFTPTFTKIQPFYPTVIWFGGVPAFIPTVQEPAGLG
jgi:hypothetical protein